MPVSFNPNSASNADGGIFGLPYSKDESNVVLIPVPWEATTSYGGGASNGPKAILEASKQIDLYDTELGHFYEDGIHLLKEDPLFCKLNKQAEAPAQKVIKTGGVEFDESLIHFANEVNAISDKVNNHSYEIVKKLLVENKIVGLIGGDHSSPFGSIKAHQEKYPNMGILQIDAHMDLRKAYEGFTHSHASIFYNVMHQIQPKKLVQVGIRDICEEEFLESQNSNDCISTHYETDYMLELFTGITWSEICKRIVDDLPQEVYISFDIDGLDPSLCPNTGTPVPGGLSFAQVKYLIREVCRSGRKIVGFDLCEVSVSEHTNWDANVASRVLLYLIGWMLKSNDVN